MRFGKTFRAVCYDGRMPDARRRPASRSAAPATAKGAATRAFILETAAAVFAERGFGATTLSQLIERSGLTKGAFYFYFPSKEALALAVLHDKQQQWLTAVREEVMREPDATAQLRALGPAIVRLHHEDPSASSITRLTRELALIPGLAGQARDGTLEWIGLVAGIISRAQRDGQLRATADPQLIATIIIAAADGLKDLSDVLDPAAEAKDGYERRLAGLAELMEALLLGPR